MKTLSSRSKFYKASASIFILLFLLAYCSIEVSNKEQYQYSQLDSLYVKCIPLNTRTEIPISTYQLFSLIKFDAFSIVIQDKKYLNRYDSIVNYIKKNNQRTIYEIMDLRMMCVAYYKDNLDTIGISNFEIYYNHSDCYLNAILLHLLSEKLPLGILSGRPTHLQ